EARGLVQRHVLGSQPHLDSAIRSRLRLAGESAVLRTIPLGEARGVGAQRMHLALDELDLAGTARAGVALVGKSQAGPEARPEEVVVVVADELRAVDQLDGAHHSAINAAERDGR